MDESEKKQFIRGKDENLLNFEKPKKEKTVQKGNFFLCRPSKREIEDYYDEDAIDFEILDKINSMNY